MYREGQRICLTISFESPRPISYCGKCTVMIDFLFNKYFITCGAGSGSLYHIDLHHLGHGILKGALGEGREWARSYSSKGV